VCTEDLIEQSPESRQVSFDEALAYAKKINAVYLETSAKTGHNIQLYVSVLFLVSNFLALFHFLMDRV
jgi:hypothetical protein